MIRNFKEIVIAVPVVNLMQARAVGSRLLSEENQENWCSAIASLTADDDIADAIDAFLLN